MNQIDTKLKYNKESIHSIKQIYIHDNMKYGPFYILVLKDASGKLHEIKVHDYKHIERIISDEVVIIVDELKSKIYHSYEEIKTYYVVRSKVLFYYHNEENGTFVITFEDSTTIIWTIFNKHKHCVSDDNVYNYRSGYFGTKGDFDILKPSVHEQKIMIDSFIKKYPNLFE